MTQAQSTTPIAAAYRGSARGLLPKGQMVTCVAPNGGHILADFDRVLERECGATRPDASEPIRLVRLSDGRIGLWDDHTDFGAETRGAETGNGAALARLLEE